MRVDSLTADQNATVVSALPGDGPRSSIWRDFLLLIGLGALSFVTFFPAVHGSPLIVDDLTIVFWNPHVMGGLNAKAVWWAFRNIDQGAYFPLTWLSFQLDAQFFGTKAWGYHLINILLHSANAMLLFTFLRLAMRSSWRSAMLTALWSVHPLRVESVAWVTERKDVLCAFFGFLTLIAYVQYAKRPNRWRYFCVFTLFTLCLLCKSMLVTLPCLLLLLDYWPLGRLRNRQGAALSTSSSSLVGGQVVPTSWLWLVLEKLAMLVPAITVAVLTALGQARIGAVDGLQEVTAWARVGNAFVSYIRYFYRTFCFRDLAVFYPFRPVPLEQAISAAAAVLGITVFALWRARRNPWLTVGWLWYLGTLLPMIGLVAVGALAWATRFSYFPSIGLLIAGIWSIPVPGERWKPLYAGATIAVLLVLCSATRTQTGYWKDTFTLWDHDLQILPGEVFATHSLSVAHINKGLDLHKKGDISGALDEWRRGLQLDPSNMDLYKQYSDDLLRLGRRAEAIDLYRRAVSFEPGDAMARDRFGTLLMSDGKVGEAIFQFKRALAINPRLVHARLSLGAGMCLVDRSSEGMNQFIIALRLDPRSAEAHDGLGMILLKQQKASEAAAHFAQAVRLDPKCSRCHNNFGAALAQLGDLEAAIREFQAAVNLEPAYKGAKDNLDRLQMERDRLRKP